MKLTLDTIHQITVFEKTTRAKIKDCIEKEGSLIFIVEEGNVQKALGKDQIHLKKLTYLFKKPIKIIGFQKDPAKFVRNLLYPLKVQEILQKENRIIITTGDTKIKGRVFGREKTNLKWMKELLSKYFKNLEIEVE